MWGRNVGFRDISLVVDELEALANALGTRPNIDFLDDTFTLDKKRVLKICREIVARKLSLRWTCFSRVDTINEELMAAMAEAGCVNVFFGIDTGSELMWRGINKRLSRKMVLSTMEKAVRCFDVTASYIWGYPEEGIGEFAETVDLAFEVAKFSAEHRIVTQLNFLSPTRATPIFRDWNHRLRFAEDVPLEITTGPPLSRYQTRRGYQECRDLIVSDVRMFAPFYFYESPDLETKFEVMRHADRIVADIGKALLCAVDRALVTGTALSAVVDGANSSDPVQALANKVALCGLMGGDTIKLCSLFEGGFAVATA